MSNSWIDDVWNTNDYQTKKKNNFKIIDEYLEKAPLNILDIGCGLAWESRLFQQKYNSKYDYNHAPPKMMDNSASTTMFVFM